MIYADYDFYQNDYKGSKIAPDMFTFFAAKASRYMDKVTFGRLSRACCPGEDYDISACCCEIADEYAGYSAAHIPGGGVKKSEKIGNYSYTVGDGANSGDESGLSGLNRSLFEICRTWLSPELLYCGVGEV